MVFNPLSDKLGFSASYHDQAKVFNTASGAAFLENLDK
jgi:hypothetical protein